MSFLLKSILVFGWTILFIFSAFADPESRCRIKHCLCKVQGSVGVNKFPPIQEFKNITPRHNPNKDLKNLSVQKMLTIYFEYDKYNLNRNDQLDIHAYIKKNHFAGGFALEGHASSSGDKDYNRVLSQKRVSAVANKIRSVISRPTRSNAQSFGEKYSSRKDSAYDRKVTIRPINNFIELLDFKKTDYYLIDQSGSMKKYWPQIQKYKFWSRSAHIYLSTVNYCERGTYLNQIYSFGGTHIWYSFWNLIRKMRPGSSVTIISDFITPIPLNKEEWSRIKSRLALKKIKLSDVHFVQIKGAPVLYQMTK